MKGKIISVIGIIYIVLSVFVTKFLLDRNDYNVFETQNSYYYCNSEIKEYGATHLVLFEKMDDYTPIVGKNIYYFDANKELKNGVLASYDKDEKVFTIDDTNHSVENLLGVPKKGYFLLGTIINVLTTKVFYLIFIIVPVAFLLVYEIYLLILYVRNNKNRRDSNEENVNKN